MTKIKLTLILLALTLGLAVLAGCGGSSGSSSSTAPSERANGRTVGGSASTSDPTPDAVAGAPSNRAGGSAKKVAEGSPAVKSPAGGSNDLKSAGLPSAADGKDSAGQARTSSDRRHSNAQPHSPAHSHTERQQEKPKSNTVQSAIEKALPEVAADGTAGRVVSEKEANEIVREIVTGKGDGGQDQSGPNSVEAMVEAVLGER
jgi:hypothetical protein